VFPALTFLFGFFLGVFSAIALAICAVAER